MNSSKSYFSLAIFGIATSHAAASPIVAVNQGQWAAAISGGYVSPVTGPLTAVATRYFTQQVLVNGYSGFQQEHPALTPDIVVSDGSTSRDAMVMSWNQPATPNTLGVAAWQFAYHADPDLAGLSLELEALAPVGIQDLGIELLDGDGLAEGWFTSLPDLGHWSAGYGLDLSLTGPQGAFQSYLTDPGFDITQVVSIRFDEASLSGVDFPVPDPTGNGSAWNAWSRMAVVPSPPAWLAICAGGFWRVRRARRATIAS